MAQRIKPELADALRNDPDIATIRIDIIFESNETIRR